MKKVLTIIITNVSFPHSLFLFFGGNSIHMSIGHVDIVSQFLVAILFYSHSMYVFQFL